MGQIFQRSERGSAEGTKMKKWVLIQWTVFSSSVMFGYIHGCIYIYIYIYIFNMSIKSKNWIDQFPQLSDMIEFFIIQ